MSQSPRNRSVWSRPHALFIARLIACGFALIASHIGLPQSASAGPPEANNSPNSTVQYRRVYVPADKMDAWPRNGEKLIPIESRDFDKWIALTNDATLDRSGKPAINIAEYTGRLESSGRLQGTGRWTIDLRGNKPAFLPLEKMSLILRDAQWKDSPQQPVQIGLWGQSGRAASRWGIRVTHSGVLEFNWHIQPHAADDQIEIPWLMPTANSVRLTLDLPEGKQPRIEGGVVLASTPTPKDVAASDKKLRRWSMALSPSPDSNLRILDAAHKIPESVKTVIREDISYQVGARGLEMSTAWQIIGPADQKRELSVPVPAGLHLTSLKADGHDLIWRISRDAKSPSDTAIVEMPKREGSNPLQITVNAWQPLVLDAPWRLPRLRPEGVLWTSGNIELSVAAAYELTRMEPTDCVETGVRLIGAADSPETHTLAAYTGAAALEISLSPRNNEATIRAGSSLSLADPDLRGQLVTQWKLSRGTSHRLIGKLAAGWVIDSVETSPSDAMTEWFIDPHGDERQIEIQFSRPATSDRNVSVTINARLQRLNIAGPISPDTLRMVNWANARVAKHLLTFQSREPYTVDRVGNLAEVARDKLDDNDRALLDGTTDDKIFDIANASRGAGLQLALRRGKYAARVELGLSFANDVCRHEYRLTAEPASSPIDRLLVYSTGPLGDSVRWTDAASSTRLAAEKLAAGDARRASLPSEGEAWLLRLQQPTSRSVEISLSTSTKRHEREIVPLLCLPDAIQQQGKILVRSRSANTLRLEPVRLEAIPLPRDTQGPSDLNEQPPVCTAYRYQPADCRDALRPPKLWAGAELDKQSLLLARHIQLDSFFWPDGSGRHCASYRLETHGATEIRLSLGSEVRHVSASLDGHTVDSVIATENGQILVVHLLPQTRSTTLSLFIETHGPSLIAGRELSPPLALNEVPYLAGDWAVSIPEEFAATGTGLNNTTPEFNWRERIFGPLGRPQGARPFNPLRLGDTAGVINNLANVNAVSPASGITPGQSQTDAIEPTNDSTYTPGPSPQMPVIGWRRYSEPFIASGPAPITILHPHSITSWAVALLLICFLCGRWLRRKKIELFAVSLAIAACSALLLPVAYASLAAGAVLGLVFSLFTGRQRQSIASNDSVTQRPSHTLVAGSLALALAIGLAQLTVAEPPSTDVASRNSSADIYRVFIPTGADGRQVGTKLYVGEKFLRALMTAVAETTQGDGQWLLRRAGYSGELRETSGKPNVAAGAWTLTFSIDTLARDTTVVLPLERSQAVWTTSAMLDGVPLPLLWHANEHECAVSIAEPGRYSVAISCLPKTSVSENQNRVDLTIPPMYGANLELRIPETATDLRISHATQVAALPGALKILNAELDGTSQLGIQWSRATRQESGNQGVSVTELRWLEIKPSGIWLNVKYVLEGAGRRPDSLTVAYDSRWKLIDRDNGASNDQASADSDGKRAVRVKISPQSENRQEISLRWRLVDPPVLGNLRLPTVELTSLPAGKRWLAVSSDPSLECDISDPTANEGTVNEFFAKWGAAPENDSPQIVLSNMDGGGLSTLAIRPREAEPVVDESLDVSAGLKALQVNYVAKLVPGNFGVYRYDLSVPADLSVNKISIAAADRMVPLRWSRSAKNRVNVFFGQQLDKPFRLVLDGSTPVDTAGKASLPHVSALVNESAPQTVQLYRGDDVRVTLEGLSTSAASTSESFDAPPASWVARPVAAYYLDSNSAPARVVVQANVPKIGGETITVLARENSAWRANYRCQLHVESGDLDVLRLRVPNTWIGPFEVQSALSTTTEFKSIDGQTGILAIRFARTVAKGSSVDLRIRSPLQPSTGTAVVVPAIVAESITHRHRYLSVPEAVDSLAMLWTETGVRPAAVPQKLLANFVGPNPMRSFEIVSDPFQVANRSQETPEASPQIRLADTAIVGGEFGEQLIATRLIVAAHNLAECTLELPTGQSLVTIALDGHPAVVRPIDPLHWKVALGAPQLPQSIEIVSRAIAQNTTRGFDELRRPALLAAGKPISAEVSLWSFARPSKSMRRVIDEADEVSAVEQSALRFDRLVSIAESAKATAAELPSPDGYNWFQPWAKLLITVRSQAQQAAVPRFERAESQVSHTSDEQIAQAGERLDKWLETCRKNLTPAKVEQTTESQKSNELTIAALFAAPTVGQWTYYVAEGGSDRLDLHLDPMTGTTGQKRLVGVLLIAGILTLIIWLLRRPAAIDFLCRWPHALGILLGIAYWAWLWPSWLGILIGAGSLWLAVRFNWPGRSLRTEASTVLRSRPA